MNNKNGQKMKSVKIFFVIFFIRPIKNKRDNKYFSTKKVIDKKNGFTLHIYIKVDFEK